MKRELNVSRSLARSICITLMPLAALTLLSCGQKGKVAASYDLSFIDAMTVRDQAALNIAELAGARAAHPEVGDYARTLAESRSREIAMLKTWRDHWYPGRPQSSNIMEMPGMASSMRGMTTTSLQGLKGVDFDLRFVDMMTTHHQGAIALAEDALAKLQRPEIKELAQHMLDTASADTAMMSRWLTNWAQAGQ